MEENTRRGQHPYEIKQMQIRNHSKPRSQPRVTKSNLSMHRQPRLEPRVLAADRKCPQETEASFRRHVDASPRHPLFSSKEKRGEDRLVEVGASWHTGNAVGGRGLLPGTKDAARVGDRYKGIVSE